MRSVSVATLALALSLPFLVQALDNSDAVKVTPLSKTSASWDGKPTVYPAGPAEVTSLIVELAAGAQTGWHEHPVPSFAYVMEGELEVTREGGATKVLHAGETLAEVVGTLHNGRALGAKPVKLLVLYTGAAGQKLTIAHPEFVPAAAKPQ
jgi:quercetin dioxygenase-like cupin family protein